MRCAQGARFLPRPGTGGRCSALSGSFFAKELIHYRAYRLARPIKLAVGHVADTAVATDEEARRQEARPPRLCHRAVAVAQQRKMQRHHAGEFLDARQRLGPIYGPHPEWAS